MKQYFSLTLLFVLLLAGLPDAVRAQSDGGAVQGATTICANTPGPTLRLTGYRGTVLYWESSNSTPANFQPISGTAGDITYTVPSLTTTTVYRAVVRLGSAAPDRSLPATIVVNTLSSDGGELTIGGAPGENVQVVCSGDAPAELVLRDYTGDIVRWERSTDNVNWTPFTNTSETFRPSSLSQTTWYRVVVQNGNCSSATSSSAQIQVQGDGFGGFLTGTTTACANSNAGTLQLNDFVGNIVRWEQSNNSLFLDSPPQSIVTEIANTESSYSYADLPVGTTYFRVVVEPAPGCPGVYSELTEVNVSPGSDAGMIASSTGAATLNLCSGENQPVFTLDVDLPAGNEIIRWEFLRSPDEVDWGDSDPANDDRLLAPTAVLATSATSLVIDVNNPPAGLSNPLRFMETDENVFWYVRIISRSFSCPQDTTDIPFLLNYSGNPCCDNPGDPDNFELAYVDGNDEVIASPIGGPWTSLRVGYDWTAPSAAPDDLQYLLFNRRLGRAFEQEPTDAILNSDGTFINTADEPFVDVEDGTTYEFYIQSECPSEAGESDIQVPVEQLVSDTVTRTICTEVQEGLITTGDEVVVNGNSATISWQDQSSNAQYLVLYRPQGSSAPFVQEITAEQQITLTGLSFDTQYQVQVRKLCFLNGDYVLPQGQPQLLTSISNGGTYEYETVRFRVEEGAPLCEDFGFSWSKSAGSPTGNDLARAATTDMEGNVYVTGIFRGSADFGSFTLSSNNPAFYDTYVAKYDVYGTVIWAVKIGSGTEQYSESGNGIAVDMDGNVFVTGRFEGAASIGNTILRSNGEEDIFVARFDANDGSLFWARSAGGARKDAGLGLELGAFGSVYVTGYVTGDVLFDQTASSGATDNTDIFLAKYTKSGGLEWLQRGGNATQNDVSRNVATDASGNVFIAGGFGGNSSDDVADFGGITLQNNSGDANSFLVKYNIDGTPVWAKSISDDYNEANGVGIDSDGNVYITGWFLGDVLFARGQGGPLGQDVRLQSETAATSTAPTIDFYLAKYKDMGTTVSEVWATREGWRGDDVARGLVIDSEDNVYITGYFNSDAIWVNDPAFLLENDLNGLGRSDIFVAKYSGNATILQTASAGGLADDGAFGIAIDMNDVVYISGDFKETANFGSDIEVNSAGGNWDAYLAQISCNPAECRNRPTPTGLFASNVGTNMVSVSWDVPEGASGATYDLRYRLLEDQSWTEITEITAPPYVLENLFAGGTYEIQVRINQILGTECPIPAPYSEPISITQNGVNVCQTPINLIEENVANNEVLLAWDEVPGAAFYILRYREIGDSEWIVIDNVPTNIWSIGGLETNTLYEASVRAQCSEELASPFSTPLPFNTTFGNCLQPEELRVENITPTSADVEWLEVPEAAEYQLQWRRVGDRIWNGTLIVLENRFTIENLQPETEYEYRIRTLCGQLNNNSPFTANEVFTTSPNCQPPLFIDVLRTTETTAELSWDAVEGADFYEVQYKPSEFPDWGDGMMERTDGQENTWVIEDLEPGVQYDVRIRTNCGNDNLSSYSDVEAFITENACGRPAQIDILDRTANSFRVQWTGQASAGYIFEYRVKGSGDTWVSSTETVNTKEVTGLSVGQTYEVRVRAVCVDGTNSLWTTSEIELTGCEAPEIQVDVLRSDFVSISWEPVPGAFEYRVSWREEASSGPGQSAIATHPQTTFEIEGLAPETKYIVTLSVDCGNGFGTSIQTEEITTLLECRNPVNISAMINEATPTVVPITWDPAAGATEYIVEWRENEPNADWTGVEATRNVFFISQFPQFVAPLKCDTRYEYRLRSVCGNEVADDYTAADFFTTADCVEGCEAPVLRPTQTGVTTANVNWDPVASATEYRVSWRVSEFGQNWVTIDVPNPATTSYTIQNISPGTEYDFRVQAICVSTRTEWSTGEFTTDVARLAGAKASGETSFRVYPNPNNGVFTVGVTSPAAQSANMTIYDVTGREIYANAYEIEAGENTVPFELNGYPAGVYMLKLNMGDSIETAKVIIE